MAGTTAGAIDVVDPQNLTRTTSIAVGSSPVQVAVSDDGNFAYVSLAGESAVAKVDLVRHEVVQKVTVPTPPVQLYLTPDGARLLSADQGTADAPGDTVSIIDVATMSVTATVTTGAGPHGVVVDPSGRLAWVTNLYADTVSVLDLTNLAVTATITVGDMPNGISFSPVTATGASADTAVDVPDYSTDAAGDEGDGGDDAGHGHGEGDHHG
ncbi:YncE family protein [Cellulomonas fimi]|nr:YncE family protein [Cellulomonas fimi]MDC7120596.1 YncE family protein [Cellulomonas fimi]